MGRRLGLARLEALIESVDRDLNLANSTLTNCTITTNQTCTFQGATVFTRTSVTNLGDNGEIPITATCAQVDANGGHRTGIRFAGAGSAGQILFVNNTGGENLIFDGTPSTAKLAGVGADSGNHDTLPPNFMGMFVSDGTIWYLIAGGVDTQPDVGMTAG